MSDNPKQAVKELKNGQEVIVTPLTSIYLKMLDAQAAKRHPAPDPEPYRKILESSLSKKKSDAKDNPAYLKALADWNTVVDHTKLGLVLDAAVSHPDKAVLIAEHADHIAAFKTLTEGPIGAALVSDWVCVLFMFLTDTEEEIGSLYRIASGATPLSDGDISAGLAYFRRVEVR